MICGWQIHYSASRVHVLPSASSQIRQNPPPERPPTLSQTTACLGERWPLGDVQGPSLFHVSSTSVLSAVRLNISFKTDGILILAPSCDVLSRIHFPIRRSPSSSSFFLPRRCACLSASATDNSTFCPRFFDILQRCQLFRPDLILKNNAQLTKLGLYSCINIFFFKI